MKSKILVIFFFAFSAYCNAQSLIQGSISKGTGNSVDVWLKPNFNNNTQYLYQIGLPISFPASDNPTLSDLTVTLDPGFVSSFGNNYTVGIAAQAHNTSNTLKYYFVYLIRGGAGASSPQSWTSGSAFKVLNVSFAHSGSVDTAKIKLADFQDGGSDGQGNFYTVDGNANYYVTSNSVGNFYSITSQSTTGGNSSEGYAQTIDSVILSTKSIIHNIKPEINNTPKAFQLQSLYPNPANDFINLKINAPVNEQTTLLISNINGNVVKQQNVSLSVGLNKIELNINNLPSGSYFIELTSKNDKLKQQYKFIKK